MADIFIFAFQSVPKQMTEETCTLCSYIHDWAKGGEFLIFCLQFIFPSSHFYEENVYKSLLGEIIIVPYMSFLAGNDLQDLLWSSIAR